MLQQLLVIFIIAAAVIGLALFIRNERRHGCSCADGDCTTSEHCGCESCSLKQQCEHRK